MLKNKSKVHNLIKHGKKYPQQSKEWFNKRHNILTASDIGTVLSSNPHKTRLTLLNEKSMAEPIVYNCGEATRHGQKYEPIAIQFFEQLHNDKVHSCGLLIHPEYDFLGASPDGLRECGRMLEIKCLHSRNMVGEIPEYYWIQVQIQLEVADLEVCDFFECKFLEIFDKDEYDNYFGVNKGVGYNDDGSEFYWRLDGFRCREVKRDREWFKKNLSQISEFHKDMLNSRNNKRLAKLKESARPVKRTRNNCEKVIIGEYRDWNGWVSATEISNYMMRDPILDWLSHHGDVAGFLKDRDISSNHDFNLYFQEMGNKFEDAIFKNLLKRFPDDVKTVASKYEAKSSAKRDETFEMMKAGVPIIYQGVLHNQYDQTFGIPDLLIRSDYINKIFEKEILTKDEEKQCAPNLDKWHYRVFDIKFKKLKFKVDGEHLQNVKRVRANKGQIIIYNRALSILQGYTAKRCYLLGYDNPFEKVGHVSMDEDLVADVDKAIMWIKDLKIHGNKWSVYPATRDELRPNMSNHEDFPWGNAKREIAEKSNELTLMYNIGYRERSSLNEKGIYRWDDPKFGSDILGKGKRAQILDQMILSNRDDVEFNIRFGKDFNKDCIKYKGGIEFFVDFEIVNGIHDDFEDIVNYKDISTQCPAKNVEVIYLIGLGWREGVGGWNFEYFIVDSLSSDDENKIVNKWLKRMGELRGDYIEAPVYHWTNAEKSWTNKVLKRGGVENIKINWVDLHKTFKDGMITFKGLKSFGLKDVAKGMFNNGMIKTNWESSTIDGMAAMMVAYNFYKGCEKDIAILNDVIKYNEVDCRVMYDILEYLRSL